MKKPPNIINNKFITQMVTKLNNNYLLLIRPHGLKKKISVIRVDDNMHFFSLKTITVLKDELPDTGYVMISNEFNKVYVVGGMTNNVFVTNATVINITENDGELDILLEKIDTDFTIAMPSVISNEDGFTLQGGFTASGILNNRNYVVNHKNVNMLKCNINSDSITSTVIIKNMTSYENVLLPTNITNNVIAGRLLARDINLPSDTTDSNVEISITPVTSPTYIHVSKATLGYKELTVLFCGNKLEMPILSNIISYNSEATGVDYFKKLMYVGEHGQLLELSIDLKLTKTPAIYDMVCIKNNILFVACDTLDGKNLSMQIKKIPEEYFNN